MSEASPEPPYEEVTIKSVDELMLELTTRLGKPGYVYRGMRRSSWKMTSSLGRSPSLGKVLGFKAPQPQTQRREAEALTTFMEASRRLGSRRPEGDLVGWLVEMQHYGAPTRLLDWTSMAAVAAYFAYEEPDDDPNETRCIWALNWSAVQQYYEIPQLVEVSPTSVPDAGQPRTPESEAERLSRAIVGGTGVPLPIRPLEPDSRMLAQHGLLTATTNDSLSLDADTVHSEILKKIPNLGSGPTLVKFLLPKNRSSVLTRLRHMGFSRHRLFPDLEGLGADLTDRMSGDGGDFGPMSFS